MSRTPPDGAEWDETNEASVLFDLWLLQQALTPLIESSISSTGLSTDEYGFCLLLTHVRDVTPGDIARITGMRPNTTSAALSRLEKRGIVTRTPNERDRRSVLVSLTPEGRRLVDEAIAANATNLDRINAAIDGTGVREAVAELERVVRSIANMPPRPDTVVTP